MEAEPFSLAAWRNEMDTMKREFAQDGSRWFPAGTGLYYDCLVCGVTLPSIAEQGAICKCGNLAVESGRVYLGLESRFRAYTVR